jgi:cytoskeletal protein CcmA (bactofilin family)
MATGENAGTWGTKTNTNLDIIEKAIAGYVEQAVTSGGTTALSITDGDATESTSVARHAVIKLTGTITGNSIVTVPDSVEKVYIVTNGTSGAYTVQFKTASGTGITFGVSEKTTRLVYSDGTNLVDAGFGGSLDIEGRELVLDADGDTTITADTDDQIDIKIAGADDFQFTANTFTAQAGSTIAAQALTATTVTASGIIKTDDTTEATSTTDGSLQTDGGLSVAKDAVFGDDVKLLSDSAVLSFGADSDTTLTHTDGTGLTLNSTNKLTFGDTGTYIHQSADGVLDLVSDSEIEINATTIDINGAVAMDGAITGATNITLSGELDAATLDISGNADIDGTTNLDAVDIDGAVQIDAAVTVGVDDTGYDFKLFGATSGSFLLWDESDDALELTDSSPIKIGDGGDMQIYHDGSDSYITNSQGALKLATETSGIAITLGHSTSEVTVADNLTITGDLTVNGTTTTVNSTTVTIDDPIFTLGGDTAPGSDDNKDRGIEFRYHDGSSARIGFFGWDDSATGFVFYSAATNSSEVFSGTEAKLIAGSLDISGDADVDGTLEADAITINGTAIGSIYGAVAGSSSIVTTGALDSGSITSGFGNIDTGSSTITTTGLITGGSLDIDDVLINGTTIGHTDDTDLITLADGIATVAGEISVTTLDIGGTNVTATAAEINLIDGGTARGTTAVADGDGLLVNDAGTMRMTNVTTLKTYFTEGVTASAIAADDISAGDGAVTLSTTSGNITIDATANDTDIIFKGTDNSSDITMLTLDGSDAGSATFNHDIILGNDSFVRFGDAGEKITGDGTDLTINSSNDLHLTATTDINVPANVGMTFGDDGEKIEGDGTDLTISSSNKTTIDSASDIVLDADSGDIEFHDGGTKFGNITSSGVFILSSSISNYDVKINGNDGGSSITAVTFDMSEAGAATFNSSITSGAGLVIADAGNIGSASDTDAIAIASNGVVTFSQAPVFPDGSIAVADLDIDGATDIGEAIVDADLFIVDNGAGGTNRKVAASRIVTYIDANSSAASVGKAIAMAIVFG